MLPLARRGAAALALLLGQSVALGVANASSSDFDGIWSVSIMAEDLSCPTSTIPVQVSNGTISVAGFGANATGRITDSGAIRLEIATGEDAVRIDGSARGREASGTWKLASAGCEGRWSAQIQE